MNRNNVKKVYAWGNAKWYDYFKNIWNKLTASEAENELKYFLQNNLDGTNTILELGCGTALNLEKIFYLDLKFKKYSGLDFSPDMLGIAKDKFKNTPNAGFHRIDITKFYPANNKFDIILCTWVLSHLRSSSDFINQAQELLTSQGKMFIIFYSKPRWFIDMWLYPMSKYFFKSIPVSDKEVYLFKNVQTKHKYSANITTSILIYSS